MVLKAGCSRCTLGIPDWTFATCFIAVVTMVSVEPVSGLFVTASIARTTFAAVASERAVCVNTSTDVTPASTPTRGTTGQT